MNNTFTRQRAHTDPYRLRDVEVDLFVIKQSGNSTLSVNDSRKSRANSLRVKMQIKSKSIHIKFGKF